MIFSGFKSLPSIKTTFTLPMDNIFLMAVVYPWKHLFHDYSSIFFFQSTAWHNNIEQFTALVDTKKFFKAYRLLRNDIEAFRVLKKLVHLQDIRMILSLLLVKSNAYQRTKVIDLIKQHLLIICGHNFFPKNLNRSLQIWYSMHTETHLAKCAWTSLYKLDGYS